MSNSEFFLMVAVPVCIVIHFIPWIVAWLRGHHNTLAIFILNLCLGWSVLGWVAALVWACTAVRREAVVAR